MPHRLKYLLPLLTLVVAARAQDTVPLPFHEEWDTYSVTTSGYVNGWYICKNGISDNTVLQGNNLHGGLTTGSTAGSGTTFATPVFDALPDTFSFRIYGSQLHGHDAEVVFGYIPDGSVIDDASDVCPLFVPYDTVTLSVSNEWQRTTVAMQPYYDLYGSAHRLAIRLCNNYSQRVYLDEIGAWPTSMFPCPTRTNKGQDFWVTFPYNYHETVNYNPGQLRLKMTGAAGTTVTVTGGGNTYFDTLGTDGTATLVVGDNNNLPVATPYAGGYHVTAAGDIALYACNYVQCSQDIATVLPTFSLDTAYIVQDYPSWEYGAQVAIVAAEDGTQLTLTVPCDIQGTSIVAGTTLTPTLMQGEAYLLIADGDNAAFSGMQVSSNGKPFALFQGGRRIKVPVDGSGSDLLYEQAIPIRYWGREFIVPTARQQMSNNYIRITSSGDGCQLNIDGTGLPILDAGETYEYVVPIGQTAHITASMPVCVILYLASYNNTLGDPSSVTIPPLDGGICHSIFQTDVTPATLPGNHYLNIVCHSSIDSTLLLDGNPLPAGGVSSTVGQYKVHCVDIPWTPANQGTHTLENPQGGFVAYTYGLGSWESYAYPLGFRLDTLEAEPPPGPARVHDTVELRDTVCFGHAYEENGFSVSAEETSHSSTVERFWVVDSGDTVLHRHLVLTVLPPIETELTLYFMYGDTLIYNDSSLSAPGTYRFLFIAADGCDSVVIVHLEYKEILIEASADGVCPGDTVTLTATGIRLLRWLSTPPDPDLVSQQGQTSVHVSPLQTTTYYVYPPDGDTVLASHTVGIEAPPVLCITVNRSFVDFDFPVVIFTDCSEGSARSTWEFSDGIVLTTPRARRQFHDLTFDSLAVRLTTCNSFDCCVDTLFSMPVRIRSVWFPNTFIPDADCNNRFGCHTSLTVTEYGLYVYNRQGLLVYHTDDVNALWDGTRDGVPLPQGAYVYYWHVRDDSDYNQSGTGTVTLLR